MEWDIAPMFLAAIFVAIVIPAVVVTATGALLLYPISRRCAALLEAMADEKKTKLSAVVDQYNEVDGLVEEVQGLSAELQQLQSRQDSLEGLIGEGRSRVRAQLEE